MKTSREWPAVELANWDKFILRVARFVSASTIRPAFFFRGQADAEWLLTPKLLRVLPSDTRPARALELERIALELFKSQAHLHYDAASMPSMQFGPQGNFVEWSSLMQHHGAPTRLLDWTASPYVAAYFAVESSFDRPGAIFVVHYVSASAPFRERYGEVLQNSDNECRKEDAPEVIMFTGPIRKTERLVAQQGEFSPGPNVLCNHDRVITNACLAAAERDPDRIWMQKWIVPAALKQDFLRHLRVMNITASALFPGLDGLGRAVMEIFRIGALELG